MKQNKITTANVVILAIGLFVGLTIAYISILATQQVQAQEQGTFPEQKHDVKLIIMNHKTGTTKVVKYDALYLYEQKTDVDISDSKLNKIKRAFGTDQFLFRYEESSFRARYNVFDLIITFDTPAGYEIKIKFV